MGTPEFAATILEDMIEHHEVMAVYTRPDAVRGRGSVKEPSPVKKLAEKYGLAVYTPASLRDKEVQDHIRALEPDVICVAAYGAILPPEVLDIPRFGCLNVHASLLPSWRGAAPIERAILSDTVETGVCVMRMEPGLDTGSYCVCRTTNVEDKDAEALGDELANLGSHALLTALIHLREGATDWVAQDDTKATYAEKIGKGELHLDPRESARTNVLKVRASSGAHPAKCRVGKRSVTITKAKSVDGESEKLVAGIACGEVRYLEKRLFFGASDGAFEVLEVRPDGKSLMDAKAFASGIQNIRDETLYWDKTHV